MLPLASSRAIEVSSPLSQALTPMRSVTVAFAADFLGAAAAGVRPRTDSGSGLGLILVLRLGLFGCVRLCLALFGLLGFGFGLGLGLFGLLGLGLFGLVLVCSALFGLFGLLGLFGLFGFVRFCLVWFVLFGSIAAVRIVRWRSALFGFVRLGLVAFGPGWGCSACSAVFDCVRACSVWVWVVWAAVCSAG